MYTIDRLINVLILTYQCSSTYRIAPEYANWTHVFENAKDSVVKNICNILDLADDWLQLLTFVTVVVLTLRNPIRDAYLKQWRTVLIIEIK